MNKRTNLCISSQTCMEIGYSAELSVAHNETVKEERYIPCMANTFGMKKESF